MPLGAAGTALKAFFKHVSQAVTYTTEGLVLLKYLKKLEELQGLMKACEHSADDLERLIIKENYELSIADISKEAAARSITAGDLQRHFTHYINRRKLRELAELSEAAVDICELVFHVLRNVYLKGGCAFML